ncbi:MAG TPA: glycosyltransferase, partial [Terracidiphilus sp.]
MSDHPGKLIVTHHADTLGRRVLRLLGDPFVARVMRRASHIIVSSSRYLDSSGELAPFRDKCRIIPLGIDMPDLPSAGNARVRELRERFGDRAILAVGRLYKGFDVLIRAMKYVESKLVLVGSGPLAAQLASLAAAEGATGKISILGPVRDLGPYLNAACLFVLPSINRAEAFGLAQVEAMAAGLP